MARKIKREFLAQALRAYLEPLGDDYLTALDAANLSIEFLDGMGLLDRFQVDMEEISEAKEPAAVGA